MLTLAQVAGWIDLSLPLPQRQAQGLLQLRTAHVEAHRSLRAGEKVDRRVTHDEARVIHNDL
jgi:hypothetical protein